MLSHRTPTKPSELRKNEPHPMGLLAPIGKLANHLTENLVLGIQKSNEVRIGHPRSVVQATRAWNSLVGCPQKQTCEQHSQLLGREGMDETFRSFLLIVAINRPSERNQS